MAFDEAGCEAFPSLSLRSSCWTEYRLDLGIEDDEPVGDVLEAAEDRLFPDGCHLGYVVVCLAGLELLVE